MRRTLLVGAALALLVALYAALGYWVAPGYVRQALAGLAADRGLLLDVAVVRTDPFALRAELDEVAFRGPSGQVFARAERASADVAWASVAARLDPGTRTPSGAADRDRQLAAGRVRLK